MIKSFYRLFLFLTFSFVYSQDDDANIKVEKITVSKSYAPELTNIIKIRSSTSVKDMILSDNISVTYKLIDTPVISTFQPNKASPLTLQRNSSKDLDFNSQFDFGLGTFGQSNIDLSSHIDFDQSQELGIDIINTNYGNIESSIINSDESRFIFGIDHIYSSKKIQSLHKLFLENHSINYYGIESQSVVLSDPFILNKIISKQLRSKVNLFSRWKIYNSFLKEAELDFILLDDSFDSKEEKVDFKIDFLFPILGANLQVIPKFSYVNSFFKEDYFKNISIKSFYTRVETLVKFGNIENKLKYQLGGKFNYFLKKSNLDTPDVFISPELMIAYGLNNSRFQAYLKVDGGIEINDYSTLSFLNPYISPSSNLIPTQNLYNGRFGFKLFFDSDIKFNLGTHFQKRNNSYLFKRYAYDPNLTNEGYKLANSYGLVYDNISKYGFFADTSIYLGKENFLGIEIIQNTYRTSQESHPWNLPEFEGRINIDLNIFKKVRVNINSRILGKRPVTYRQVFLNQALENSPTELKYLSRLSQVKFEINYKLAPEWRAYMRSQLNLGKDKMLWDFYYLNQNLLLFGIRYGFNLRL
ncbi:MAG: hypothetical protein CMC21_03060 [Flavobacteriaceae bacterium]|nr:hypothetical protein [Flavobacteriaceae bacterium]|tara:strand:+ start:4731 stop:6479 length:1749 start_codon:yes stop_codon:yes gene_type:complete